MAFISKKKLWELSMSLSFFAIFWKSPVLNMSTVMPNGSMPCYVTPPTLHKLSKLFEVGFRWPLNLKMHLFQVSFLACPQSFLFSFSSLLLQLLLAFWFWLYFVSWLAFAPAAYDDAVGEKRQAHFLLLATDILKCKSCPFIWCHLIFRFSTISNYTQLEDFPDTIILWIHPYCRKNNRRPDNEATDVHFEGVTSDDKQGLLSEVRIQDDDEEEELAWLRMEFQLAGRTYKY